VQPGGDKPARLPPNYKATLAEMRDARPGKTHGPENPGVERAWTVGRA
jgi:hypothetical protein